MLEQAVQCAAPVSLINSQKHPVFATPCRRRVISKHSKIELAGPERLEKPPFDGCEFHNVEVTAPS
jgi:hypothetical protein